mmetsp:Transcript_3250/g.8377  ORF Transcript_3250/g.8377 Transcript_3250/m.8377 type:complete len:239 (+) Transcript_3250:304-1020(+)
MAPQASPLGAAVHRRPQRVAPGAHVWAAIASVSPGLPTYLATNKLTALADHPQLGTWHSATAVAALPILDVALPEAVPLRAPVVAPVARPTPAAIPRLHVGGNLRRLQLYLHLVWKHERKGPVATRGAAASGFSCVRGAAPPSGDCTEGLHVSLASPGLPASGALARPGLRRGDVGDLERPNVAAPDSLGDTSVSCFVKPAQIGRAIDAVLDDEREDGGNGCRVLEHHDVAIWVDSLR